jgi:bifunctional UDP-N-acetylglucosamine pyrophosphorylase/glucosamine-1-phosphate N-acetyltransferase
VTTLPAATHQCLGFGELGARVDPEQRIGRELDGAAGEPLATRDSHVAPAECVVQDPPLGTGDAVRTALQALNGRLAPQGGLDEVLVLYGDTPFLATEILSRLLAERRRTSAAILVSGMRPADPGPYGRLVLAVDGSLERIVEAADAGSDEQAIGLVNGGIMVIEARHARDLVVALDRNNAKSEFYLTDIVPAPILARAPTSLSPT